MLEPSVRNIRRWAQLGLLFAAIQTICLGVQFGRTDKSPSIGICLGVSVLFLILYLGYVRRLYKDEATLQAKRKFFVLSHLVSTTWYFWVALIAYLCQTNGFAVLQILFDDDPNNDLKPVARRLVITLLVVCLISLVNDVLIIRFHTERIRAITRRTYVPSADAKADRPRISSLIACLSDVAFIILSSISLSQQRDWGTIVLIILSILSFFLELRYTLSSWGTTSVDIEWHTQAQLLAVQHMLVGSTCFLVNFCLLLLWSVGLSISTIITQDGANAGAQVILSILAYGGVVVCSCILASQHTALEDPQVARTFAVAVPLDDEVSTMNPASSHLTAAVVTTPHGYRYEPIGDVGAVPAGGGAAVAVPVPLRSENSSGRGFV